MFSNYNEKIYDIFERDMEKCRQDNDRNIATIMKSIYFTLGKDISQDLIRVMDHIAYDCCYTAPETMFSNWDKLVNGCNLYHPNDRRLEKIFNN